MRWLTISLLVLLCLAGCGGSVQVDRDFGGSEFGRYELPPDAPGGW